MSQTHKIVATLNTSANREPNSQCDAPQTRRPDPTHAPHSWPPYRLRHPAAAEHSPPDPSQRRKSATCIRTVHKNNQQQCKIQSKMKQLLRAVMNTLAEIAYIIREFDIGTVVQQIEHFGRTPIINGSKQLDAVISTVHSIHDTSGRNNELNKRTISKTESWTS